MTSATERTTPSDNFVDVAIVGGGPAGLVLASELSRLGRSVALIDPEPALAWRATYASWVDDVPERFREAFAYQWDSVIAWGHRRHELARPYAIFDNAALRALLVADLPVGTMRAASAWRAERVGSDWSVGLHGGSSVTCRVVIDAVGLHEATPAPKRAAFQTAFGVRLQSNAAPLSVSPGTAVLMDWRQAEVVGEHAEPATFLYVLDTGDGTRLIEETSLARSPGLSQTELRRRLESRIGTDAIAVGADEVVSIRMSPPPRVAKQSIPRFGASAGFVNPATGYSVATSLTRAAPTAAAIDTALCCGAGQRVDLDVINQAIWPRSARRTRALHEFGLLALLRLSPSECGEFFDAFFELPPPAWSGYLSAESSPKAVALAMTKIFAASSWRLRRRLVVLGPGLLVRGLTG